MCLFAQAQHREVFAYSGQGYQPDPVCQLCWGHAETWIWDTHKKPSKSDPSTFLTWLGRYFDMDNFLSPMYPDRSWDEFPCLLRLCNRGHISVSRLESNSPPESLKITPYIPRPMASPTSAYHRQANMTHMDTSMDESLMNDIGLSLDLASESHFTTNFGLNFHIGGFSNVDDCKVLNSGFDDLNNSGSWL
jgi:hypothetical protein